MHQSSRAIMGDFARRLADELGGRSVRVLDVGSQDVNGSYRDLFSFPGVEYVGLDIAPGPNVDVVVADLYVWNEVPDAGFDVVISGQALEHIPFPWLVVEEICRKLRVGGLACLIAPSGGPEHRYPVDCYRYFSDGMRSLAEWAGLEVLHVATMPAETGFADGSNQWGDCHCVLRKSAASRPLAASVAARRRATPEVAGSPAVASVADIQPESWQPAVLAAARALPATPAATTGPGTTDPATAAGVVSSQNRIAELQAQVDALRAALVSACEWQGVWHQRAFHRWRPPPGLLPQLDLRRKKRWGLGRVKPHPADIRETAAADPVANRLALEALVTERCAHARDLPATDPLTAAPPTAPPAIDICAVTHNSSRWIAGFATSLAGLAYPTSQITLHVVDNSSTDDTLARLEEAAAELRSAGVRVCISSRSNRGFGAGMNAAIREGSAPFVLATNVDLSFEPDALARVVATAMADVTLAAAWELRQKPYEHPKFYDPVTGTTNWNSHAAVLLRRSAWQQVGGYDETLFMYGEDVELSYRLRRDGFLLRYCPAAVVWHYTYDSPGHVKPLQYVGSLFANLYLRVRYGTPTDALAALPMALSLVNTKHEVFPGSRRAALGAVARFVSAAPAAVLKRRRCKAHFPFRGWDYELTRIGAFVPAAARPAESPVVSIITRTYEGRDAFLRQAALSVAHQTYRPIQHIVVQDGGDSLRPQAEQISRSTGLPITFLGRLRSGRSACGNAGLAAATGRWCLFLDDDDLLFADHVETLVGAVQAAPDAVAAYTTAWEVQTEASGTPAGDYREVAYTVPDSLREDFDYRSLLHHNLMAIQSVLFARSLFLERGGFDEQLELLEDWDLWKRYAYRNRFVFVPKVTSLFRTPADPAIRESREQAMHAAYPTAVARTDAWINSVSR